VGTLPGPSTDRHLGRLLEHRVPEMPHEDVRRTADVLSRLLISYVLDPFEESPAEFADWFVRLVFCGVMKEPVAPRA
jgi:hypothetical protein